MSKKGVDGLTTFERQGKKISKKLKGKVYAYNLKTQEFEHIEKELFDSKSYYVGRTSKHVPKEKRKSIKWRLKCVKSHKSFI